jgi:hypothetical protein
MEMEEQHRMFVETVKELEKYDFPEFDITGIYAPPNKSHFYFSPSWHFRSGLMTKEIVEDIKDNGKLMLSIGSGSGALERFLVNQLGIGRNQITLSDKSPVMPEEFDSYIFDMFKEWPNFGKKFDYVIFPESVLLNVRYEYSPARQAGLYHIIEKSLATMKSFGQIRMNGHCQIEENSDEVNRRLKRDHLDSNLMYKPQLIVVERGHK